MSKPPLGCEGRANCGSYGAYSSHGGCRGAACLIAKREYQRELRNKDYATPTPASASGRRRQETPAPASIIKRWKDKLK